jgi:hypothetical protein
MSRIFDAQKLISNPFFTKTLGKYYTDLNKFVYNLKQLKTQLKNLKPN